MNNWISVKRGIPGANQHVLCHFDDGFIATVSTDENCEWELWADSGEVTHWMYLPEPPRKDSYENNIETICDHYGFDKQLEQLEEECAELIQAAQKLKRYHAEKTTEAFLSEVADVAVCVDEMKLFFHIGRIETIQTAKAKRQIRRIKKELKDNE